MSSSSMFFGKTTTLKLPLENEAKDFMKRATQQVMPIMNKRSWKVGTLAEFSPKNAGLLGMNWNRGSKISIRLRPAENQNSFLPYEAILETLLHELVHNVHGPHSVAFYRLLDEIKEECELLMAKNITGDTTGAGVAGFSFTGASRKLDDTHHNPLEVVSSSTLRSKAAEAALRRATHTHAHKARVLGGNTRNMQAKTPAQLAAAAAERRKMDACSCGSGLHSDDASHKQPPPATLISSTSTTTSKKTKPTASTTSSSSSKPPSSTTTTSSSSATTTTSSSLSSSRPIPTSSSSSGKRRQQAQLQSETEKTRKWQSDTQFQNNIDINTTPNTNYTTTTSTSNTNNYNNNNTNNTNTNPTNNNTTTTTNNNNHNNTTNNNIIINSNNHVAKHDSIIDQQHTHETNKATHSGGFVSKTHKHVTSNTLLLHQLLQQKQKQRSVVGGDVGCFDDNNHRHNNDNDNDNNYNDNNYNDHGNSDTNTNCNTDNDNNKPNDDDSNNNTNNNAIHYTSTNTSINDNFSNVVVDVEALDVALVLIRESSSGQHQSQLAEMTLKNILVDIIAKQQLHDVDVDVDVDVDGVDDGDVNADVDGYKIGNQQHDVDGCDEYRMSLGDTHLNNTLWSVAGTSDVLEAAGFTWDNNVMKLCDIPENLTKVKAVRSWIESRELSLLTRTDRAPVIPSHMNTNIATTTTTHMKHTDKANSSAIITIGDDDDDVKTTATLSPSVNTTIIILDDDDDDDDSNNSDNNHNNNNSSNNDDDDDNADNNNSNDNNNYTSDNDNDNSHNNDDADDNDNNRSNNTSHTNNNKPNHNKNNDDSDDDNDDHHHHDDDDNDLNCDGPSAKNNDNVVDDDCDDDDDDGSLVLLEEYWVCKDCTFHNMVLDAKLCEVCGSVKNPEVTTVT